MKNGTEHDMTQGAVAVPLIGFTIPLVLGNFFQLFYNAADSIIVGRYVGERALAAVGTSTPVMNLVILLISGLCMGASILMSSQFGAGNYEQLSRQISTTLLSGCGFSIGFSVLTILVSEPLLRLIQVPKEVMPDALAYLRIIFIGILFTFIYNFLANTLRALGDSKTPLYFLVASAILNVLGDLLFVAVFGWGVAGSAISTVLSEASSCLFCALYIRKRVPLLCLGKRWFVFDKSLMKKTISYGSTSAMQQVCLQIGKTIIQAVVNTQGVSVMAAFTAVNRVDDFAYIPQQNIGHAMTTFIAQNKGAGKKERIRRGFQSGIGIELVYGLAGSDVFWCREDYGIVYLSGRCTGGDSGKVLSASGFLDVYSSGDNEWDSGIFPWHGRSEGDTVQYFYEYGRACAGSYCDVSGIQLGICKPCVGESDRVDRDASF